MSILIQFYTVVTRTDVIEKKYPRGVEKYTKGSLIWHDDYIIGTSFKNGFDVDSHVEYLKEYNIRFDNAEISQDVAIFDQCRGILTGCDWLEFKIHEDGYSLCRLKDCEPGQIVYPKELSSPERATLAIYFPDAMLF